MEKFDKNIDALLAKQLAAESTPEEDAAIQRWLEASPENRQHLSDLVWLWERSAAGLAQPPRAVDTEAALLRVKKSMRGKGRIIPLYRQGAFWLRAAAAVLALAVAAVYWWQSGQKPEPVQIVAAEAISVDTLSDGSVVTLQQHSGLTLTSDFNRRERRLRLRGEAYFEVAPDAARPFVVEVRDLEVQVVGTAFTVDQVRDTAKIVVTVSEGKVQVRKKEQALLLSAGEQATYDLRSERLFRTTPEQGTPVFKNRVLRFDATPLRVVVEEIKKAYNVEISIKNKQLENCPLTARYNNLPLERVLELVA